MAVLAFLRTYWRPLAMLLLLLIAYLQGSAHKDAQWEAKWERQEAVHAKAMFNASEQARKSEQDWAAAFDLSATMYQESYNDLQKRRDRIMRDVAAGRLRIPPIAPAAVPEAPAHPGEPQDAGESRFSGQFGEWLVSRAAKCDEVTLKLNQAVRLLEAERGQAATP